MHLCFYFVQSTLIIFINCPLPSSILLVPPPNPTSFSTSCPFIVINNLLCLFNTHVCGGTSTGAGGNLPGITSPKKSESPSLRSSRDEALAPPPSLRYCDWLDHAQVTTAAGSWCEQQPCHVLKWAFHSSLPYWLTLHSFGFLLCSAPLALDEEVDVNDPWVPENSFILSM